MTTEKIRAFAEQKNINKTIAPHLQKTSMGLEYLPTFVLDLL